MSKHPEADEAEVCKPLPGPFAAGISQALPAASLSLPRCPVQADASLLHRPRLRDSSDCWPLKVRAGPGTNRSCTCPYPRPPAYSVGAAGQALAPGSRRGRSALLASSSSPFEGSTLQPGSAGNQRGHASWLGMHTARGVNVTEYTAWAAGSGGSRRPVPETQGQLLPSPGATDAPRGPRLQVF